MIFTDYYLASKDPNTKTRYDIIASTESYSFFEKMLVNKKNPRKGGLSFYLVNRPGHWKGKWQRQTDKAITKGDMNITSVIIPEPDLLFAYGDIFYYEDAVVIRFIDEERCNLPQDMFSGIEIFIARGQKHNQLNLFQLVMDGEYREEMESLRKSAHSLDQND